MFNRMFDAHLRVHRNVFHDVFAKITTDNVATQWHRPAIRAVIPPNTKINQNVEIMFDIC